MSVNRDRAVRNRANIVRMVARMVDATRMDLGIRLGTVDITYAPGSYKGSTKVTAKIQPLNSTEVDVFTILLDGSGDVESFRHVKYMGKVSV